VLTIRWNGDRLVYQLRYHLTLSSTSVEQTFKTVDIEELSVLLRALSEQL
jgi:hypothetical protein